MLLPLRDMAGRQTGEIEVSDAVFAAPINGEFDAPGAGSAAGKRTSGYAQDEDA